MIPRLITDHGTISVTNGSKIATGTGTSWSTILDRGAFIFLEGVDKPAVVASRRVRSYDTADDISGAAAGTYLEDDTLYFLENWPGATAAGATYIAVVYGGHAEISEDLAAYVALVATLGLVGPATTGEPASTVGRNNEIRFDFNAHNVWQKISGVWTQLTLTDWNPVGDYNAGTTYAKGDYLRSGSYNYVSNVDANVGNTPDATPQSTAYWTYVPTQSGVGDLVDVAFYCAGRPVSSELLFRHTFRGSVTVSFPIGLTDSEVNAEVAATASTVFNIYKNASLIGTITFAAAGTVATFSFTGVVTFADGDVLKVYAPATPDATLADISFCFAGSH